MSDNVKKYVLPIVMAVFMLGMFAWCIAKPQDEYSISERRALTKKPELSFDAISNGSYIKKYESYTLDQFPMRDKLRSVKALSERYVFNKKENNQLYEVDGILCKIESQEQEEMIRHANTLFGTIYETYLVPEEITPYFAIIPDKHYFLGEKNGYLSMDYEKLVQDMINGMPYATYIDIMDELTIDNYYATDSHWKQTEILPVANTLLYAMNSDNEEMDAVSKVEVREANGNMDISEYEVLSLEQPFYGVYYGQAALPVEPDTIQYLTNSSIENCKVTILDAKGEYESSVYNMDKASSNDPYEVFLSGAVPLVTIQNPEATTEKRLIIFRDSFASSLTPLLVSNYQEVVLVDLRYLNSSQLAAYVDFEDADVLFLYSTTILNNSNSMK